MERIFEKWAQQNGLSDIVGGQLKDNCLASFLMKSVLGSSLSQPIAISQISQLISKPDPDYTRRYCALLILIELVHSTPYDRSDRLDWIDSLDEFALLFDISEEQSKFVSDVWMIENCHPDLDSFDPLFVKSAPAYAHFYVLNLLLSKSHYSVALKYFAFHNPVVKTLAEAKVVTDVLGHHESLTATLQFIREFLSSKPILQASVLPDLMEEFVTSVSNNKRVYEFCHLPFSEEEVQSIPRDVLPAALESLLPSRYSAHCL